MSYFPTNLGFPSALKSPDYRPSSPFTVPEKLKPFPENIMTIDDDREKDYKPQDTGRFDGSRRRKRKSNKQKAIEQFDVNAAPISLKLFCDTIIDESESLEIDVCSDEKVKTTDEIKIEDEELAEKCAMLSLVIAQNNAPDEDLNKELIYKNEFPEEIIEVYCDSIEAPVEKFDFSKDIVEISALKPNRKLFYERRLLHAVKLRHVSSPEFIESHFPFDEKLLNIKMESLYNDDANSWNLIKSKFQDICLESESLKDLFYGKDWKQRFIKLLDLKRKSNNLQLVAICSYWMFFVDKKFDRDLRLLDIDERLFGKSRFKYFTVTQCFSYVGINFFTDYCAFPFYRDRIINLFVNNHDDIMLEIQKRKIDKIKRFKSSHRNELVLMNF